MRRTCAVFMALSWVATACGGERAPRTGVLGAPAEPRTEALELGARVLQDNAPAAGLDIYLVGVHPLRDDPHHQLEAHHFCRQLNEDFAQCALFDGNTADAHLNGIEYIISEELYQRLPADERRYWHPHNYEILSGLLIAPGLPAAADQELMRTKMNSYGKTWHVWNTGVDGRAADLIPLGEPHLGWSLNADGEARPGLIEARDRAMGVSTAEIRARRQELVPLARPQHGVDALADAFARRVKPRGVMSADQPSPAAPRK